MKKTAALSLVETIIALGLVSLVLILIIDLYPSAMATLRHAERTQVANTLASSVLDQQMALPFNQLVPGSSQELAPQSLQGITYIARWEIFPYAPGGASPAIDPNRLVGVRVTVKWSYGSNHNSIVREALVHNLPP